MSDLRLEKLAKVLVEYSTGIQPGDLVRIRGSYAAQPLAREIFRAAAALGAHPFASLEPDGFREILLRESPEEALDFYSPITRFTAETIDVDLAIGGEFNTHAMSGVPAARLARYEKSHAVHSRRIVERGETGELRWCVTLVPTVSAAQDAHMALGDYEDFVFRAMMLDRDDPVAAWKALSSQQEQYCRFLTGHDRIRIEAEDTDLTLSVKGRIWLNADGHRNFPDGEVFTGPIETSANGHIRYTFPTIHHGRGASDVRLWFEEGVVVRWEAGEGKELLDELFAMDDGARRLGEFAIGTNYEIPSFTRNILFDEKIGGTCHLAVGMSYASTGEVHRSALHWDMICDLRSGGRLTADGELFHENGRWLI